MRTYHDCIPCFARQAIDSARLVTGDRELQEKILRKVLAYISKMDLLQPPPFMARKIHKIIRKETGVKEPYAKIKKQSNRFALSLYPELKEMVRSSKNPFETAVRLAIAGNIIDFGVHSAKTELDEKQVHDSITDALKSDVDEKVIQKLFNEIQRANSILYVADNAGEIVFDRVLLEEMPLDKITVAVKGYPIINDATLSDAKEAGLMNIVKVIENGSDAPGTILDLCSKKFRRVFNTAGLVISKGQGNYETLSSSSKNIFFLFKAKCPVIANHLKVEIGSMVIRKNV